MLQLEDFSCSEVLSHHVKVTYLESNVRTSNLKSSNVAGGLRSTTDFAIHADEFQLNFALIRTNSNLLSVVALFKKIYNGSRI